MERSAGTGLPGPHAPSRRVQAQLPPELTGGSPSSHLQSRAPPGRPGTRTPRPQLSFLPATGGSGCTEQGTGRPPSAPTSRPFQVWATPHTTVPPDSPQAGNGPPLDMATRPLQEAAATRGPPARTPGAALPGRGWHAPLSQRGLAHLDHADDLLDGSAEIVHPGRDQQCWKGTRGALRSGHHAAPRAERWGLQAAGPCLDAAPRVRCWATLPRGRASSEHPACHWATPWCAQPAGGLGSGARRARGRREDRAQPLSASASPLRGPVWEVLGGPGR